MQKVLVATSNDNSLRSDLSGWTVEDGDQVYVACMEGRGHKAETIEVGHVGTNFEIHLPMTPLHALAEGWKLLAPPLVHTEMNMDCQQITTVEWWFTKG